MQGQGNKPHGMLNLRVVVAESSDKLFLPAPSTKAAEDGEEQVTGEEEDSEED